MYVVKLKRDLHSDKNPQEYTKVIEAKKNIIIL